MSSWADADDSVPSSPSSPAAVAVALPGKRVVETRVDADGNTVRVVKRVITETVQRAPTAVDLRRKWRKFGFSAEEDKDTVAIEAPIMLELGSTDPIEKAARDEVMRLMNAAAMQRIDLQHPSVRKLQQMGGPSASASAAAAAAAAAAGEGSAGPSSPTSAEEPKTWAQKREKDKAGAAGAGGGKGGDGKDKSGVIEKTTIRILNVADNISEMELRKLFGPPNGLGEIARVFIAKDQDGGRRGFVYIKYQTERDAAKAIEKMNRVAFKNVIMNVDYGTLKS